MASTAPYYQAIPAADFQDPTLQSYSATSDQDLSQISQQIVQLAEQDAQAISERGDENAQLVGLLEAVKTASQPDAHHTAERALQITARTPSALGKRKRGNSDLDSPAADGAKRTRQDADLLSKDHNFSQPSQAAVRAAGVHSAAALFRSPSASTAKKYTRPPMSKLYASLHLAPEDFLHLQSAAKSYMLDPAHTERQDCVGNRGKGDTDMVKLRLFNCVRDFLADGVGDRFFPETLQNDSSTIDGPGFGEPGLQDQQKWIWPRDGNQIVSLVTPLMRRMVTNERQRMYAIETRKGGSGKKGEGDISEADISLLDLSMQEKRAPPLAVSVPADGGNVLKTSHPDSAATRIPPPPPKCVSNVIQFVFMHGGVKLLRFDWPDPAGLPDHAHMTFEKLIRTVSDHTIGVRAALTDSDLSSAKHGRSSKSSSSELARQKSKEAILASGRSLANSSKDPDRPYAPPETSTGNNTDEAGEELRRELQLHIDRGPNDKSSEDLTGQPLPENDENNIQSLESLNVTVQALAPNGLIDITNEDLWNDAKKQVAASVWLEGCLRIIAEIGS